MNNQKVKIYKIGEFAKLTGVTERTLRYYDRQGLLKPSVRNSQGHRFYLEQDLFRLQKIITLKYLGFTLDEITNYIEVPEDNLQESLNVQYELLKLKRQQLDEVLATLERMRLILDGAGEIDSDLLLMFIANIQNEELQKEWLAKRMPTAFLNAVFMEGWPSQKRIEVERAMTGALIKLKRFCAQGKDPLDPEVQEIGMQLVDVIQTIVGPAISEMSDEELAKLENLGDNELSPVLFPAGLTKEEEAYMEKIFEKINILELGTGGEVNEQ